MKLIELSLRFYVVVLLMVGFILVWRLVIGVNVATSVLTAIGVTILFMWLYRKDIGTLIRGFRK